MPYTQTGDAGSPRSLTRWSDAAESRGAVSVRLAFGETGYVPMPPDADPLDRLLGSALLDPDLRRRLLAAPGMVAIAEGAPIVLAAELASIQAADLEDFARQAGSAWDHRARTPSDAVSEELAPVLAAEPWESRALLAGLVR